ncbi:helix-turn-helix domain-containing protein [Klugiella xanthotipulae]|nr:helix-turn-helix transcriptional regulator [Klugiella xanthotipulae]
MSAPHSEAARILGSRIREHRLAIQVSQMDLADLASMHFTNLGKIERGEANPSLTTIVRIAVALDTDPGKLVAGIAGDDLPDRSHRVTAADLIRERQKGNS